MLKGWVHSHDNIMVDITFIFLPSNIFNELLVSKKIFYEANITPLAKFSFLEFGNIAF